MRISSNTIFEAGIRPIQQQQVDLLKTQQQLSTGRRILTPADDPVGSARALEVTQSSSLNGQYTTNRKTATSTLGLEESILGSVTSLIQDLQTVAVNAGNPTLSNENRASLATELRGRYQELLGLANSNDGNGQYLFAGYQGATKPFTETSPGNVAYNGDQGQRLVQISASRQLAVSDAGLDVFLRIRNGNGSFVTAASATNAGTGVIDGGIVLDPTKWAAAANKDFTIKFAVDGSVNPPVTTYDIIDNVSGNSLLTGAAPAAVGPYPRTYTSGSAISLKNQGAEPAFDYGVQLAIEGAPAGGDTFTVKASSSESLFSSLDSLIVALQTKSGTALTNSLNTALTNLNNALTNVSTVRASVGSRMKEVDTAQSAGEDLNLQYQQTLSNLQDVDYAKVISELAQQQTSLQAAQQSFVKITGLSLFNYL